MESNREEIKLGFLEIKQNEFDSTRILNGFLCFLREKKEEIERNKTPNSIGEDGIGFGRKRRRKTALGFGSAAAAGGGRRI